MKELDFDGPCVCSNLRKKQNRDLHTMLSSPLKPFSNPSTLTSHKTTSPAKPTYTLLFISHTPSTPLNRTNPVLLRTNNLYAQLSAPHTCKNTLHATD